MTPHVLHIVEVGLRVKDLPRMVAFYQEVLGLEIVRTYPKYVFMKAGELNSPLGRGGHPQLLVLFDREVALDIALTTLDHLAFEIYIEQFAAERERLQGMGLELTERAWTGIHAWLRARSLFFDDPEGNTIELIAHDPSMPEDIASG
jgi:catechol 2,3-dioxygenase-like lactoylglutathione lyase family enzyme